MTDRGRTPARFPGAAGRKRAFATELRTEPAGVAIYADNDRMSGVAVWVAGVMSALSPQCTAEIIVRHPSGSRRFEQQGMRVRSLHGDGTSGRGRLTTLRDAYRYGRRERPRLVHCTAPQLPVIIGLRLAGVPVTLSLHVFPQTRLGYQVVRVAARLSRVLITVSDALAEAVAEHGRVSPNRMRTIRNGVPAPDQVALHPTERATFGVASRLTSRKGLDDLADWAPSLVAESGWPLHIFGEGPWGDTLRASLTDPRIVFRGRVDDEEALYREVGVLLVLSEEETFCRPAIEAAVRGIPVISRHPLPALRELLGPLVVVPDSALGENLVEVAGRVADGSLGVPCPADLHSAVSPSLLISTQSAQVASLVLSHARPQK